MDDAIRTGLAQGEQAGSRYRLMPPRQTPTGQMGAQLGHRVGSSIEFMDYRTYQPGDDLRRVDWSAYARSDRLTVKLYREEVCPHVDVLLDASRSMAISASPKAQAAAALAAAITTAADNAKFTHNLYLAGEQIRPIPGGNARPGAWGGIQFAGTSALDTLLEQGPPLWRRRGVRVLISDLLFDAQPAHLLRQLARDAASLCVVQVLGRCDITPPPRGNFRLVDHETGQVRELYIDAAAEKRFQQRLNDHQAAWQDACRQVGATMTQLIAEPLLKSWDLSDLVKLGVLQVN
ncbi:MAG: DUF58 domain-containing protein [Phycisphaerales bacterium JB063]